MARHAASPPPDAGFPHALVGEDAPPPAKVPPRLFALALRAAEHDPDDDEDAPLYAGGKWRLAAAVATLRDEANAAVPDRNKASDGTIGDPRHAAAGDASDHNPWLAVNGVGVVRALDLTNDPKLKLADRFEQLRARAAAGELPQLTGGGYLILSGRITKPDFSGWAVYKGSDPHVAHGHVSVSRDRAGFDNPAPWGAFGTEHPPAPAPVEKPQVKPAPAPPPPPPPPAPAPVDLVGSGAGLRGDAGNAGPRVAQLQEFLNRYAPAYSKLAVDGVWGPQTTAVLRTFAQRSGIPEADGRNIGPKIAAALYRAGFGRPLSTAQLRVLGHVRRNR